MHSERERDQRAWANAPAARRDPIRKLTWLIAAVCLIVMLPPRAGAEITAAQRREANALHVKIRRAGSLFTQKKFDECAELVGEVQTRVESMAEKADEDLIELLEPIYRRVIRAHALLELEGIELDPLIQLKPPPAPAAA